MKTMIEGVMVAYLMTVRHLWGRDGPQLGRQQPRAPGKGLRGRKNLKTNTHTPEDNRVTGIIVVHLVAFNFELL